MGLPAERTYGSSILLRFHISELIVTSYITNHYAIILEGKPACFLWGFRLRLTRRLINRRKKADICTRGTTDRSRAPRVLGRSEAVDWLCFSFG